MILDKELQFSASQAVTADATSTNVIDLGVGRNIFDGEPMAVVMNVEVAADATTGDETYEVEIHTDDNASMSSSTQLVGQAILAAALTAGSTHIIPIPVGATVERYLALKYDVGGTSPSVTVSAYLQPLSMIPKQRYYANRSTITN